MWERCSNAGANSPAYRRTYRWIASNYRPQNCPTGQRALSGGAIGAAGGAVLGTVVAGNPAVGAAVGGAVGAGVGAALPQIENGLNGN